MSNRRIHFKRDQLNELWDLWRSGSNQKEIAEALLVSRPCVARRLREQGGVAPAPRRRRPDALTFDERCEIFAGIQRSESCRAIARRLGRSQSTVSREIIRCGGRQNYRPHLAEQRADEMARRPQTCKLATNRALCDQVSRMLAKDLSPQQIAGRLRHEFPGDQTMHVSHETIYRTLYVQARGALKKELTQHLRRSRDLRKPNAQKVEDSKIKDPISISERPAEAEDRAVPGHWEGDLLMGKQMRSQVITLVERSTRWVMLIKTDTKSAADVADALSEKIKELPKQLKRSVTWDRGTEMAAHAEFTLATDVPVFFCDPYSPWQRGSNENTNGLLRQYLKKDADLSLVSQEQLDEIAQRLNERPRQTLEFHTPAEKMAELLQ